MSTRRAKQIIYGMFYLIFFAAFIGAAWFLAMLIVPRGPSTAPCTPSTCAPTSTAPLLTAPVITFTSSPGHYTFLAQVANTDPYYAASYFDYAVDLYDASGTVLQSIPGSSFVYAGQTKYLVVPNVAVGEPFVSAGLVLSNAYWQDTASLGAIPQFTKENVVSSNGSTTVSVSGQLTNGNIASTHYVFVDVIFTTSNGNPIGASVTILNNVGPGKTVDFSVSYPQTGAIDPSRNEVLVYGLK